MQQFKTKKTIIASMISYMALGLNFATAQTNEDQQSSAMLEEIIVTAQVREESLSDIPISITAVSGKKLAESNIVRMDDLQNFVPNLSTTETGLSTQLYIRGIGTGNNQGFEQSVGQYIDGVYYGRQQLIRMPFLDLERVEVLRGPQSILFGKNSIAGALNMTAAKPTDEFEGRLSVNLSDESDIAEFTGVLSGPLTENISGRLAFRKYDESGWMENTFLNQDELDRDEMAVRGSLKWDVNDKLTVNFKAERNEFESVGRTIEVVQDDPALAGAPIPGANFSQILSILGHPGAITEADQNNQRQSDIADSSDNRVNNYTLTADYSLGDITLTSTTGFVDYAFDEFCDCDFVAAPIFAARLTEEYEQFSQEIRLVSPGQETIDWIAGAFYQESELVYDDTLIIPQNSVLGIVAGGALAPATNTNMNRDYSADSDLWAVFAQGTWNVNDAFRVTLGGRFTSEDKTAQRSLNIIDSATGAITTNPITPIIYLRALQIETEQSTGHSLTGERSEDVFTPLVNVQWDMNDNTMLYASASTGTKAGGFDTRSNIVRSWEFEDEDATTFELGAKNTLFDNSVELNVAAYLTEYKNLQVAQFDGALGFVVGNANKTQVWGMEADGRWAISDGLTASYSFAYLNHEFKDYQNGNCYNRQIPDGNIVNGVPLCDYTGKSGQFTPEWTGSFALNHSHNFASGLELRTTLDLNYKGKQNTHVNLDPSWEIDAATFVNLRVGLYSDNWDVSLFAQNLTDEQQFTYVGNTPLSGSTFGTNTFYSFLTRPQTTYIQASFQF